MSRPSPFDAMATDYDRGFTESAIGGRMRAAVWRRLDVCFQGGDRVLELNCGTGEDAVHLARRGVSVVATDIAPSMLDVARAKVARAGVRDLVELRQLAIESLPALASASSAPFDGALSNFGGLNCVADLRPVVSGLAGALRPGAVALLCVMGPVVPWEWGWYLGRGEPATAFRRLRPRGVEWRGLTIRYPSIRAVRRAFAPWFRRRRVSAIGALVPPSYAERWAAARPGLLERLDRWERRVETWPLVPWLADHFLLELERV
jgi:SAM-dependent methyltransferase